MREKWGLDRPVYVIAEMSGNHNQSFERAVRIIQAAKEAGADAVKIQTYTPETITIDCDNEYFRIKGTIWEGKNLFRLYGEAFTPWEWQAGLQKAALDAGLDFFSTPFDPTSVDFLESLQVECYKIASFEVVDIPLLRCVARTGKPVIMSTGMASLAEIHEAVRTLRENGCPELALLKCVSAYPAPASEMNLRTIPHLGQAFGAIPGLSDHTLGITVPVAAVALGARLIEKHFTLSRSEPGPDTAFSLEPGEFKAMVQAVRETEGALGEVSYDLTEKQRGSIVFRKSLFVTRDMKPGEAFGPENVRSIRPGNGLHPRYLDLVLGRTAVRDIKRGTPLAWDMVGGPGEGAA